MKVQQASISLIMNITMSDTQHSQQLNEGGIITILMQELNQKLSYAFTVLSRGYPIADTQLEGILSRLPGLKNRPDIKHLLRMLHIYQRPRSNSKENFFNQLTRILKATSHQLQLPILCCHLLSGDTNLFRQTCNAEASPFLQKFGRVFAGLFPSRQVKPEDVARTSNALFHIFVSNEEAGMMGNIHWLLARKSIEEYYNQQQLIIGENQKQVYQLAMGGSLLLEKWKKHPFRLFWANLFCYYNQIYFIYHGCHINRALASWSHVSPPLCWSEAIQEKEFDPTEQMAFYLAVSLLKQGPHEERIMQCENDNGQNEFNAAYYLFQSCFPQQSSHAYLTTLIFFKIAALRKQQDVIAALLHFKFKEILASLDNKIQYIIFMEYFLSVEEFLLLLQLQESQVWRLSISSAFKVKIAQFYAKNHILSTDIIHNLEVGDLIQLVFRSPALIHPIRGPQLITLIKRMQKSIVEKMKSYLRAEKEETIDNSVSEFAIAWNKFYSVMKDGKVEFVEKQGLTFNAYFYPLFKQIVTLPQNYPDVIFKYLLDFIRCVKNENKNKVISLPQIQEFESLTLTSFLPLLSSEQQSGINQEWELFKSKKEPINTNS